MAKGAGIFILLTLAVVIDSSCGFHTESIQRSKRGILDTIACTPKLISAAQSCSEDLDERTKGFDRENADEAAKCCIYTDFRRCVRSIAQRECGTDTGESVDAAIRTVQSALTDKVLSFSVFFCVFFCLSFSVSD